MKPSECLIAINSRLSYALASFSLLARADTKRCNRHETWALSNLLRGGYGGHFIFIIPDLELVVTMTSSPNPGGGRRERLRALYNTVEDRILSGVVHRSAPRGAE